MSSEPVVRVNGLCKKFRLYRHARDRLLELFGTGSRHSDFTALSAISFTLAPGEALGIIGENGSGKSTLLKLVAGLLVPDAGTVERNGKITGLLELGTGFNPELSGRRNIYLNGVYLGLGRQELARMESGIADFAELGQFIDEPLKSYSSGMAMRLGFSIAIHARPRCFIIDEALSVGDVRFQQKCFSRLRDFLRDGGSLLFVSHDLAAVKMLCDRALLLDQGRLRYLGDPEEAINQFNETLAARGDSGRGSWPGYGNGDVFFTDVRLLNGAGRAAEIFISGEPMSIAFDFDCKRPVAAVTFGFMLRDRFGQDVFGINGALLGNQTDVTGAGSGRFVIDALNLGKGNYTVNLSAHTGLTHLEKCFHWWDNAAAFELILASDYHFSGMARLQTRLEFQKCFNPQSPPSAD